MSSVLAKNTLYLTVASVGQKVLAFAYFVLLARIMGRENTGAYSLALSLVTVFQVVSDIGVTNIVIRELAKDAAGAKAIVSRALALKVPFTILAVLIANASTWLLDYDASIRLLVLLGSVVLAADSFSVFFYGILRGLHVLAYESLGLLMSQSLTLVAGGVILFMHPSLPLLVIALMVGSLFNFGFSFVQVAKRLGRNILRPVFDIGAMRTLLAASIPFFLAAIFVKLYSYIDNQFIYAYLGTPMVGVYSVAYKFTYAFQFIPLAFVAALYPGMSAVVHKDPKALAHLFDRAVWYLLLIAVPISFGMFTIADKAVALVGHGYVEAVPLLRLLTFVLIPTFLSFPVGSLLNAAGRQRTMTVIYGGTMVVNAFFDWMLIPAFGLMGAVYGSLISITALFLAGACFLPRIIPGYRFGPSMFIAVRILCSGAVMAVLTRWLLDRSAFGGFIGFYIACAAVVFILMLFATRSFRRSDVADFVRLFKRPKPAYVEDASLNG